jgi:hypothetical protein
MYRLFYDKVVSGDILFVLDFARKENLEDRQSR